MICKTPSHWYFLVFLTLFSTVCIDAQGDSLRLEDIMQGEGFVGYSPRNPFWNEQGDTIFFEWRRAGDTDFRWYALSTASKHTTTAVPVPAAQWQFIPAPDGRYNTDYSVKVYEKFGDIYWYDIKKRVCKKIIQTTHYETNPTFSYDQRFVFFQVDNNLYSWEISTGAICQRTDFVKGNPPGSAKNTAAEAYLQRQERKLFPHLVDHSDEWEKQAAPKKPKAIYIQDFNLSQIKISPDNRFITFRLSKYNNAPATEVPDYITESGYVRSTKARAKVGTSVLLQSQLGIYDTARDTVYFCNSNQIPDIFRRPNFLREYQTDSLPFDSLYVTPREVVYHGPYFSHQGYAVVEIKALDNKDRWIMQVDMPTGTLLPIDQQHDEAWIGGPGIENWDDTPGTMGWLGDGETIYFQSEATGYSHLYTHHIRNHQRIAITQGQYEVHEVLLSRDKNTFYLVTSEVDPGEQHLYQCPAIVGSPKLTRITTDKGIHRPVLSPDERHIADLFSYSNQPWDLFLLPNKANTAPSAIRRLTESPSAAFRAYPWRDPQLVYFGAADGAQVRARLYLPDTSRRNGAAVIFVHGAGYLQNVTFGWSYYQREFMFHNLLADHGYTVLDIDYRGSAGYGRDCRTGIYRHMGGKDLSDHIDGARYLVEQQGVDPQRIGIYGGSYGGFITLMALFKHPDVFRCGAALRAVTDWAHYNQAYTRDILNLPAEDSLAFQRSSPIFFAEGLRNRLLILHGMIDDNVQFQDVVRLSQRLIDLRKENWEMAIYPIERHGFTHTNSWLDEYRRIFKLFQETLQQ